MAKDKDEEPTPKARGGRRRQKPLQAAYPPSRLAGLNSFKPGQSGNPGGRPKSLVEITQLARELTPAAILRLHKICHDPAAPYRDQIAAAIAISDRGCGRPAVGIFHSSSNTLSGAPEGFEGEGSANALILAARGSKDERVLAQLLAEAERIKQAIAREKQAYEARVANAAEALSRGEPVDGLTALLLKARAANVEREAPPPASSASKPL